MQHVLLNRQFLHKKRYKSSSISFFSLSPDRFILEIKCAVFISLVIFLAAGSLCQGVERNRYMDFLCFMFLRDC